MGVDKSKGLSDKKKTWLCTSDWSLLTVRPIKIHPAEKSASKQNARFVSFRKVPAPLDSSLKKRLHCYGN